MEASLAPTRIRKQKGHQTNNATWTAEEDQLLIELASQNSSSTISWSQLARSFPNKTAPQLAGRWSKVLDPSLVKGSWTRAEDEIIMNYVNQNGEKDWSKLAEMLVGRTGKQCRERFKNHLDPNVIRQAWTPQEDQLLIEFHNKLGNQWTKIASMMKGRSDNCVKNRWNSTIKKRLERMQKGEPLVMKRGRKPKSYIPTPIPKPETIEQPSPELFSPLSSPLLRTRTRGPVIEFIPISESLKIGDQIHPSIHTVLPTLQENRVNLERLLSEAV